MSRQYLRQARLRVGANGLLENEFDGFRIVFRIEKSLNPTPNTSTISIFNLSKDSRTRFEAKGAICSLGVGYDGNVEQIFIGNIAKATTKKQGTDWITEIECGDGEKAFKEAKLDVSLPAGANAQDVLGKLGDAFKGVQDGGVTAVKDVLLTQFKSFGTGLVLSGSASEVLDSLTKTVGLEWSIQDGELQILEQDKALLGQAFVASASTGLIGSPGAIKTAGQDPQATEGGIEFSMLLQPALKPGRQVRVESELLTGTYRVAKVNHEGDSHGGSWISKCEAYLIK